MFGVLAKIVGLIYGNEWGVTEETPHPPVGHLLPQGEKAMEPLTRC